MEKRKRVRAGLALSVAAGGVLGVAALAWILPAYACTVQAHVETRPRRADPGAVIRVEGSLFEPGGGPVNVYWNGEGGMLMSPGELGAASWKPNVAPAWPTGSSTRASRAPVAPLNR